MVNFVKNKRTSLVTKFFSKMRNLKDAVRCMVMLLAAATPIYLAAAEYESKTITVYPADLFESTTTEDILSFSDQGFDFIASRGSMTGQPTISTKQNFLRLYDDNSLTITSTDGLDITRVVLNISGYGMGRDIILGRAYGWAQDPDDLSVWTGKNPEFKIIVAYPASQQDYDFVNIESITITYLEEVEEEPEPEPEYGAVGMRIINPRATYSGTEGTLVFGLEVTDDDGVEKFTVTACDASTGVEYGRGEYTRADAAGEEPAAAPLREAASGDSYGISSPLPPSGIAEGNRPTLRLGVTASYPDGTETRIDEQDEPTVAPSGGGSTGVEDAITTEEAIPEYYDLTGRRILNPGRGLYIVKQGTRTSKQSL